MLSADCCQAFKVSSGIIDGLHNFRHGQLSGLMVGVVDKLMVGVDDKLMVGVDDKLMPMVGVGDKLIVWWLRNAWFGWWRNKWFR